MALFPSLYLAKFFVDASTSTYRQDMETYKVELQRQGAYTQAALNNQLAINSYLHINDEDVLDLKRHNLDRKDLQDSIRRETAKRAALEASAGGSFGRAGNSAELTTLNIERFGLKALARKDLNREIRFRSFEQRRKNVELSTRSKNNLAFSNLSISGDRTGLALEILGSGVQSVIDAKRGTETRQIIGGLLR